MNGTFRIGKFLVEPQLNTILGVEKTVRVEPKVMRVLVCLVENAGEVVPKEKLIHSVWADTFVTDDVLTRSISELRKVFEDDAREPRFIQTIARSGYRLIAAVSYDREKPAAEPLATSGFSDATAINRPRPWLGTRTRISTAVALALVIAGLLWIYFARSSTKSSLPPMTVVPLTSYAGGEFLGAFSPDGTQIAFGWTGEKEGSFIADIYVKQIGIESAPLRLTTSVTGNNVCSLWSPDGQRIAFIRYSETEPGIWMPAIWVVPFLGGGAERKLLPLDTVPFPPLWDWSRDGKLIAVSEISKDEQCRIVLVSPDTHERHLLTSPIEDLGYSTSVGDFDPVFSPDSREVAFIRQDSGVSRDIYIVPVSGGKPRRLTFDNTPSLGGCTWTADGREIIYSSDPTGFSGSSLWRISAAGGVAERIAIAGNNALNPRTSPRGNRLAYMEDSGEANIYRVELSNTTVSKRPPTKLIASTRNDSFPRFSPDGRRIAFQSDRSGPSEIWMCDNDGSNPVPLTDLKKFAGRPRWSPDGQEIAFDFFEERRAHILVARAEGGQPRSVTSGDCDDFFPSWSRDGQWIYFTSNRTGVFQVWKAAARGGDAVQLTRQGGVVALESPDGKYVYYTKFPAPGIWRMPVDGGEELQFFDSFKSDYDSHWAVVSDGIYFVTVDAEGVVTMEFFDFATANARKVVRLGKDHIGDITVSPDRRQVLYTQHDGGGRDIKLIENFR